MNLTAFTFNKAEANPATTNFYKVNIKSTFQRMRQQNPVPQNCLSARMTISCIDKSQQAQSLDKKLIWKQNKRDSKPDIKRMHD